MITPADVGLECEAQAVRVWRSPRALSRKRVFHSSPAIRYRHIHECKSFSVSPITKLLLHMYPLSNMYSYLVFTDIAAFKCLSALHHLLCYCTVHMAQMCVQFTLTLYLQTGIFCIPAGSIIPLHNHPGMTVFSKILYGAAHVKSYDWIDTAESLNLSKGRILFFWNHGHFLLANVNRVLDCSC